MKGEPTTLLEATRYFSNPERCRKYLEAKRWPNGVTCPTCGAPVKTFLTTEQRWQCSKRHPRRKFTVKTGSVMEDSLLSLEVWLIGNAKNGISSWEVHRALGVTKKTAWFHLHRIRYAMQNGGMFEKLIDHVEEEGRKSDGPASGLHPAIQGMPAKLPCSDDPDTPPSWSYARLDKRAETFTSVLKIVCEDTINLVDGR
ncbi:IS1595 family transposase [bacterium]|nr:MAG: IS1595 family transposase [bacterium]